MWEDVCTISDRFHFEAAWAELSSWYGKPGLIMRAHNEHLLQVEPLAGDLNSLFALAVDVRDAVSSVSDDHLVVFTFLIDRLVYSLSKKLPTQLQIYWGQFAYKLRPSLPSFKDFDNWIDIAVGAEEYRRNNFYTPIACTQKVSRFLNSGNRAVTMRQIVARTP